MRILEKSLLVGFIHHKTELSTKFHTHIALVDLAR